ncbi:MAG: methyltransferase domain-containing protein [Bacteroidia bacterium]|nr:methyltransferase domain-containing protein [Bacteroidia bacterium]
MEKDKEWFAEWFDSPYYHILYQKHDMKEAEFFLRNLVTHFNPDKNAKIIDLACGKGRHSIFLNTLGFDVTGVDLSQQSILAAKEHVNEKLHFEVQDLRNLQMPAHFDIALNLFTSFGYFDSFETDLLVLKQIHSILKPNGFLLIDFFNTNKVLDCLIKTEIKEICHIKFKISKVVEDGQIIKNICFTDMGHEYCYSEKVQALRLNNFKELLQKSGFDLTNIFGNYALESFDELQSDRLIILARKKDVR